MSERPKRKSIPLGVKVLALERKLCEVMGCERIEYDHRPGLEQRDVLPDGSDYDPPQLDPAFIDPVPAGEHLERTIADTKARKKIRHNREANEEFCRRMAQKQPGQPRQKSRHWPSRPMNGKRN